MSLWNKMVVSLVFSILFTVGCQSVEENSAPSLTVEQAIKDYRMKATSLDEFKKTLHKQGLVAFQSDVNKLDDDTSFDYSLFRNDTYSYIHFEFSDESKEDQGLRIGFDREEAKNIRVIHSEGLTPEEDGLQFQVSDGLNQKWVGIYFESKKQDGFPNGEITLKYGSENWRSHY